MGNEFTRRQFIRDGAAVAAALTAGLGARQKAQGAERIEVGTSKILNYNPDMEYRRCGRTGLMVSVVALGGHWKRLVKIIGGQEDKGWMTMGIDRQEFQKNIGRSCISPKGFNEPGRFLLHLNDLHGLL